MKELLKSNLIKSHIGGSVIIIIIIIKNEKYLERIHQVNKKKKTFNVLTHIEANTIRISIDIQLKEEKHFYFN